ncbi:uncharacterized protein TM35_000311620 [Trypanosoma theileri]|uniref:Uncharacterized protein n=1 Tax=Trypanosoma theileri TaxID=67003 RepID=A0A1X0NMM3_9TRYP|nr:uncharacterized protein TM35_000311620 [Trypanosoma theileri]ORC85976.1 hypothetical protein TM35_000311620 [Trypanosoma theileri]
MSMVHFRVLCLLAIVFCCLGEARTKRRRADDPEKELFIVEEEGDEKEEDIESMVNSANQTVQMVKEAHALALESLKERNGCMDAAEAAGEASKKPTEFVARISELITKVNNNLSYILKDEEKVEEKEKSEALINQAVEAAKTAREKAVSTKIKAIDTAVKGVMALNASLLFYKKYDEEKQKYEGNTTDPSLKLKLLRLTTSVEKVLGKMQNMTKVALDAIDDADTARRTTLEAEHQANLAEGSAEKVRAVIQELEKAITTANEKREEEKRERERQIALEKEKEAQRQREAEQKRIEAEQRQREEEQRQREEEQRQKEAEQRQREEEQRQKEAEQRQREEEQKKIETKRKEKEAKAEEQKQLEEQPSAQGERTKAVNGQKSDKANTSTKQFSPSPRDANVSETSASALLKSDALAKAVYQLDGSSSPALLRVPLLLLLLLSVLGCMTVC